MPMLLAYFAFWYLMPILVGTGKDAAYLALAAVLTYLGQVLTLRW